ncbi:hypothetical protein AYO22_08418 [Fonsecaea multimorphosa]|nr:hypothetical protein AYO22_08418 [Fonsecaea multimorphosa]
MSVATETIHQTSSEFIQIVAMSESGSEASKAAKKREYNRNAQRVFRQRRKEHLNKLEAAQRELNSIQVEEVERLRRENQALAQENESLKAAYGSQASSPGPTMSPGEVRGSPSGYMAYGTAPGGYLGPVSGAPSYTPGPVTVSMPQPATTPLSSASSDPSTLVVVVPNNIREIHPDFGRGAGDSGKSTVLKQLKLINGGGYSGEDRWYFKGVIFANMVRSMQAILEAMDVFEIPFANPTVDRHATTIFAQTQRTAPAELSPEVYLAIRVLWADGGVQECFSRCSEFQVCDSAQYTPPDRMAYNSYFDAIDRIASPNFLPNDQDILRSRHKTTGVAEFSFTSSKSPKDTGTLYRVIDVGGQRSERKKWMHFFEGVDLVLFLVALSEYDQTLYEDGSVNRLQEAVDLFRSVCYESPWFRGNTAVKVVFNKTDLFRDKLRRSPLEVYFPDYQASITMSVVTDMAWLIPSKPIGGSDYAAACRYISDKFTMWPPAGHLQTRRPDSFICATDTAQVRMLMDSVVGTL